MPIDSAAVTRQSFSLAAEGYDRAEVDSFLAEVAAALGALEHQVRDSETGPQLEAILQGAQESAAALRERAESEARELVEAARRDGQRAREQAKSQAEEELRRARAAARSLVERAESLAEGVGRIREDLERSGRDLGEQLGKISEPILGAVRDRVTALDAEIDLMAAGLGRSGASEPSTEVEPEPSTAEEPEPSTTKPAEPKPAPAAEPKPAREAAAESEPGTALAPEDVPAVEAELEAQQDASGAAEAGRPGAERARLVALNLALSGVDRDEAARELRERLGVEEPEPLLDEAYRRAGRSD